MLVNNKYSGCWVVKQGTIGYNNGMQIISIVVFGITTGLLVVVASVFVKRTSLSLFELERRRDKGDKSASEELRREVLLNDVLSLKRVVLAACLIGVTATAIWAFDWLVGLLIAAGVALFYARLASIDGVRNWSQARYDSLEPKLLSFIERRPTLFRIIASVQPVSPMTSVASREELDYLIKHSGNLLSENEKRIMTSSLEFEQRAVGEIMIPRGVVTTISKDELIGPLTLNDLHQSGHSRFPVIDGDIDHVVGILHIQDLLMLQDKKSQTAEKLMEKKVHFIHSDASLDYALCAFLKAKHHLFIVLNEYRETAGIITLEDCVEALLGRKIIDEFDQHQDLRAKATQQSKSNNNTPHGVNL